MSDGSSRSNSGRGARTNASKKKNIQSSAVVRRMNYAELDKFIENHNAGDFIGVIAPKKVTIGNVPMVQIDSYKSHDDKGRTIYSTTYKSTLQASNGEYPVVDIAVAGKKSGRLTKYEFVTKGSNKTRIWGAYRNA